MRNTLVKIILTFAALLSVLVPCVAQTTETVNRGKETPSPALMEARRHFSDPFLSPVSFRTMDAFFPVEEVEAGKRPWKLPYAPVDISPEVVFGDEAVSFEEALRRTYTNALLIIKDGEIIYERYLNGAGPSDSFIGWSVSKSVVSVLTGILVEKGDMALDAPIETYLPELTGTAYEGVTLENMLLMRAGASYREFSPEGYSDTEVLRESSTVKNEKRFTDFAELKLYKKAPQGEIFNYSTLTSSLIGRALENVSGLSMAALTEKYIWKPAGMESDGFWVLDGEPPEGRAVAGGTFNASLRDFGRFGLMMLGQGQANGRNIVSADWVRRSTENTFAEPVIPEEGRGYQYQWWTMMETSRFEAIGIHGQFVTVDPDYNMVIVKLSHWPDKGGLQYELDNFAFYEAVTKAVSAIDAGEEN